MIPKINTNTIKTATAEAVVAAKKARDNTVTALMVLPIIFISLAGVLDSVGFWNPKQAAQASQMPSSFLSDEQKYHTPPEPQKESPEPSPEQAKLQETQTQAKPLLTEEVKMEMAGIIDGFLLEQQSPMAGQGRVFVDLGVKYNRHPYAVLAITGADTSFGKHLATPFNPGNVGNTDSCPTCGNGHDSWASGIEAIFQTLTNNYLGNATKLCHLSYGGWRVCPEASTFMNGKIYASSPENWERNTNYWFSYLLLQPYSNQFSIILSDYYQLSIG